MTLRKSLLLGLILLLLASFFAFDLGQYLTLASLKAQQGALQAQVAAEPWLAAGVFFAVYVAVTGLSLPGASLMTLVAGALFGLWQGLLIVSFASTLGALLSMFSSRFLLQDWVQQRFGQRVGVKALDVRRLAAHVERRPVVLRVADHVAQHLQKAVAALGDQHHQAQGLRLQRCVQLGLRQVAQGGCGLQHPLRGGVAHARPLVQHPIDRGRGDAGQLGDVGDARAAGTAGVGGGLGHVIFNQNPSFSLLVFDGFCGYYHSAFDAERHQKPSVQTLG